MKKIISIKSSLVVLSLFSASVVFSQTTDSTKAKKTDNKNNHQPIKPAPKPAAEKKPTPVKTLPKKKVTVDEKKYKVLFYEMKAAGRGKSVEGFVEFASGHVSSELMSDKLKIENGYYQIVHDSTYTEDDTEMHLLKIESHIEAQNEEIVWEATIINQDIDGTVVQTKGGLEKKRFEFSGSEKGKK